MPKRNTPQWERLVRCLRLQPGSGAGDLVEVIFEPVGALCRWLARHVTLVVALAALAATLTAVERDITDTQRVDQRLVRLARDLETTDTVRSDLALLDAAQLAYLRTRTQSHRQERDRAVMQVYLSLRALRRTLPAGDAQEQRWAKLTQLISARIDDCLDDAADIRTGRHRTAYETATRLFDIVQSIQSDQLARLEREQQARGALAHANAVRLTVALSCCIFLLLACEFLVSWQRRRSELP